MSTPTLDQIISAVSTLDRSELRSLEAAVRVALEIRSEGRLSTDSHDEKSEFSEGPGLNDQALAILEDTETFSLSLADQALLAAMVLSDGYHQDVFSSRDINDIIEESGRP
ncbi:MAG: hypothetical protein AAGC68_02990, partial [Verrucomicrobiota bacterium]